MRLTHQTRGNRQSIVDFGLHSSNYGIHHITDPFFFTVYQHQQVQIRVFMGFTARLRAEDLNVQETLAQILLELLSNPASGFSSQKR